jgi:hypothetical protein
VIVALLALGCRADPDAPSPPTTVGTADTAPTFVWTSTADTGNAVSGQVDAMPHGVHVSIEATTATSIEVACVAGTEPEELHSMTSPAATLHDIRLMGMLAATTYDCTVRADGRAITTSQVTTPPLAIDTPWSIVESLPTRSFGAYTLFNLGESDNDNEPHQLVVVDPEGRVRWAKLLSGEFPDCDATIHDDGTLLYGGGQGIPPTLETLSGDVLFQAPERPFNERYHHHAERLPSGEFLTMTQAQDSAVVAGVSQTWDGFHIERIAPDGSIRWSWASQSATDAGILPVPAVGADDPWHANSVAVDADAITYVNLRQKSWVLAIAPDGEVLWRLGPGGDFALVDGSGSPLPDSEWFWGAHAPEHHGNRILFHDNGYRRPGSYTTRALELVIDPIGRTATPTWSWTEPGWYEPIWGDIDELPTGTYLLARGHCGGCNKNLRSEVVEMERATGEVVWRLRFDETRWGIYRAQRIDGCAMFHNARYCPG